MAFQNDEFPSGGWRLRWWPLLAFVTIFLAATFLAALFTPPIYLLLRRLAPVFPFAAHVLTKPLTKLVDRLRWFPLALGLVLLLRGTNWRSWFRSKQRIFSFFLSGGIIALLLHVLRLISTGWQLRFQLWAIPMAFIVAFLVAFLEELVFRGLLFRSTARAFGGGGGAVASSLFFAGVHFRVVPGAPSMGSLEAVSLATSLSGGWDLLTAFWINFRLLPFLSLFLFGLLLCRWTQRFRSLFPAIGFHWGIVFVVLLFRRLVDFGPVGGTPIDSPFCPLLLVLLLLRDYYDA